MPQIKSYNTALETAKSLALHIKLQVNSADNRFFMAVSGGSTPKMLFEALVKIKEDIEWGKIQLYWVDERCVPPANDESNYKMTFNALLKEVPLPKKNIHRIRGELEPKEALDDYKKQLEHLPVSNGYPQFDLIILGMGDDGHTASIFPPEIHLIKSDDALAIGTNLYSGQKRITLTGRTINNAREIIFYVTGAAKAEVLDKILNKKDNYLDYPAAHIEEAVWYVDNEALRL